MRLDPDVLLSKPSSKVRRWLLYSDAAALRDEHYLNEAKH